MSSPARLAQAVRAPWRVRAGSLAAAVLPEGRTSMGHIADPLDAVFGDSWPAAPTWIVAVDLDSGRRVVFGRDGAPPATTAEAVRASCAIPAYYEPAVIGGRRHVDGGVHSTTNADLVGRERPDLVLVSAPMSAARGTRLGAGDAVRRIARRSLAREVTRLRRRGIPVVVFQPTAADLAVMSGNSLDPRKQGPVCRQVFDSTARRLARSDVRARLGALGDVA